VESKEASLYPILDNEQPQVNDLPHAICDTSAPINSTTFLGNTSPLVELCPNSP
jgi:hypothetical protein